MANELRFAIQGMHCAACVRRVTAALQSVNGVGVESVNVGSAAVRVNDKVAADDVVAAIQRIGFQASLKN
jgi:copper chaperone CopZ